MTYQTNSVRLEQLVAERNIQLYDYEDDGFLLISDNKYIYHLPADFSVEQLDVVETSLNDPAPTKNIDKSEITESKTDTNCDGINCQCNSCEKKQEVIKDIVTINVKYDIFLSSEETAILTDLVLSELDTSDVTLRIQFLTPPESWSVVLSPFLENNTLVETMRKNLLKILLSGQFLPISESDRIFFSAHNVNLEFVHDLIAEAFCFSEQTQMVLSQLAGFGFRVPVVWYVDNQTVTQIPQLVDEAMTLNFNSGFLLPTFQYCLFKNTNLKHDISYDNYLQLLVCMYEKYPYYDDCLFPLNDILRSSVKPNRINFVRQEFYDHHTHKFLPITLTDLERTLQIFFTHIFLWQRWEIFCKIKEFISDV